MAEYLNIGAAAQSSLVKSIKESSNETWLTIAKKLGISRSLIFFYRSGTVKMPRKNLEKLLRLTSFSTENIRLSYTNYDNDRKNPYFPEMCEELVEFLGILYGDGHLGTNNYIVGVTGNAHSDYLHHQIRVYFLFKKLFGLDAHFRFQNNAVHTMLGSKKLQEFFVQRFSFPIGEKKGRMTVPSIVYEKDEYKRAFLRGLFDTDGGVHRHHTSSIQIQFTSHDRSFLNDICDLYHEFGFNAKINGTDLQLRGKAEIDRFFKEIRPANPKHLYKHAEFKRTGIVPRHKDIDYSVLNSSWSKG